MAAAGAQWLRPLRLRPAAAAAAASAVLKAGRAPRRQARYTHGAVLECVLARHPGVRAPVAPDVFEVREAPAREKALELAAGHVRCDTLWLSVDPCVQTRHTPEPTCRVLLRACAACAGRRTGRPA